MDHHAKSPAGVRLPTGLRRWILSADPEAGLEMLVQARPPLAPAAVLPILSAQVGAPGPPRRRCLCERGARVHPFIGKD